MKTMTKVKMVAALMLAAALTANAQNQNGGGGRNGPPPGEGPGGGPGGGDQQGGPGGDFQPPSPEDIAKHMLEKFDADKDGKLNAEELAKAIASRPHRGPPGGGQQGGPGGSPQGGPNGASQNGDRPQPPAPEKIAAKWIEEFDADKNGSLDAAELAKALEAHRPPPPPEGGFGGPRGGGQRPGE